MANKHYKVTYKVQEQENTEEFNEGGELDKEELRLAARRVIRKKHPGVKHWEINVVSIAEISG